MSGRRAFLVFCGVVAVLAAGSFAAQEYEIGGPLAGVKLPVYATQHGEAPGHPGCIPELAAEARRQDPKATAFTAEGLPPELQVYPGSVEHYRAYWFKYCPIRSFFDAQSLVRNFPAKEIAGVRPEQVEPYAEPVFWVPRHAEPVATGRFNRPVDVVRCKAGDPVLTLDLGELEQGMYVLRVIGAVESKDIERHRKPLYLRAQINDGPNGEVNIYRLRLGYVEEFYSVAEIYVHVAAKRRIQARLSVDKGSAVDLLVHNVDLHDALAGVTRGVIKMHTSRGTLAERAGLRPPRPSAPQGDRSERDGRLWNALPSVNAQLGILIGEGGDNAPSNRPNEGAAGKTPAQVAEEWGQWKSAEPTSPVLMTNAKLNLSYSVEDLKAQRPLPDPYPFKDDGAGLYYPSADPQKPAQNWFPMATAVRDRVQGYYSLIEQKAQQYHRTGDPQAARDAAFMLCRFAYDLPGVDPANALSSMLLQPGAYGRDLRCRRRETTQSVYGNFIRFILPIVCYDYLYDYIQGNEELAASVGRFVPWVKTPQDVVKLLDVYLVQTIVKRALRYHYVGDGRQPARMAEMATLVGNNEATDPWMEWLFSRTHFYPNPTSGIQDLMITGTDRDGRSPIGSYSYMIGEFSADGLAEDLEAYIQGGGTPRFDLRDNRRYPKTLASLDFYTASRTAGLYFPRIGDVVGPDKAYAAWFNAITKPADRAWRWTKDPRFAYIIKHYAGRGGRTDEEWKEIEDAAAKVQRAPWMENRSRVLPGWAGLLEAGVEHDDFRFRRAVMVRVGWGYGHGHNDTLDLQVHAHGLPVTLDGGQRPGYSEPGDPNTYIHNVVVVEGRNWLGHSWVRSLGDAEGARYLCAQAAPLHGTRLYRRQVALIDVDEGSGSQPLTPAQCGPSPAGLPKDVVTPNSYVFDCFRVSGASQHAYALHGPVVDLPSTQAPQPRANVADARAIEGDALPEEVKDTPFMSKLRGEKYWAAAPDTLEVVFPIPKKRYMSARIGGAGTEAFLMGPGAFDPASPDKFLKWRVFGVEGARVLKGDLFCRQWQYYIPNFYVRRNGENLESAFAAVIEPYVKEPFITGARSLQIADNEADALRATAVEVKTRNGHTDVCFADGRPDRERKVGDLVLSGEFAYCSTDAEGLRQATLVGGTALSAPEIRLRAAARERTGRIVQADYLEKTVRIDAPWPAGSRRGLVEIGSMPESGKAGYVTSYACSSVRPEGGRTALVLTHGADYYRSRVKSVDSERGIVVCALGAPGSAGDMAGIDKGFVASNEAMTKFWRADVLPWDASEGNYPFKLTGAPVAKADLEPEGALRLWEYGVGDEVRRSTTATVRRLEPGVFLVDADVDVTLGLKAAGVECSADRQAWTALQATTEGQWAQVSLGADRFADGPLYLRLRR